MPRLSDGTPELPPPPPPPPSGWPRGLASLLGLPCGVPVGLPRGVVLFAAFDFAVFGFSEATADVELLLLPPPRGEAAPPRGVRLPEPRSDDASCLATALDAAPPVLVLRALRGRSPSSATKPSAFSGATTGFAAFPAPRGFSADDDDPAPRALRGVLTFPLDDVLASAPPRGVLALAAGAIVRDWTAYPRPPKSRQTLCKTLDRFFFSSTTRGGRLRFRVLRQDFASISPAFRQGLAKSAERAHGAPAGRPERRRGRSVGGGASRGHQKRRFDARGRCHRSVVRRWSGNGCGGGCCCWLWC